MILTIVTLVFGTAKLKNLGSDLGGAIKGFKEGMRDDPQPDAAQSAPVVPTAVPLPLLADATARRSSRIDVDVVAHTDA